MIFNIDTAIFIAFLGITLGIGLFYSRGIKNIREYAVGNRNFSTATIAATLIATWISGSAFLTDISEIYQDGLFYMIPGMFGDIFSWIIICYFLAPRMGRFLGSVSVAEAMGNLYGQKVRLITSLSSTFNCVGKVAGQFKVSATILQLFFGVSSFTATLFSCLIVIIYSTFGGIRAVTFTDIIQFFTFGTIIPIIGLVIWGTFNDPHIVYETVSQNKLFDFHELLNTSNPKFWPAFTLAIYFIFPSLNPAIFQRISMAKDTKQIAQSFSIATFIRLGISILFFWIGILLLSHNPNLDPSGLFAYIIDNYTFIIGFKGLIAAGVMAMVMSTADSYINAAAVTFSYDFRKSIGIKWSEKYDLPLSYACSIIIGVLAFALAFYMKDLLKLFLMVSSFYAPIVTVPLLFAIFGFHSTSKSVIIGMLGGFITVLLWRNYFLDITNIDSVIPGIIGNFIFFLGSHYLLRQPGGWSKIEDSEIQNLKLERKRKTEKLLNNLKEFNLIKFWIKNSPKNESVYPLFGLFSIISIFSTMYSLPTEVRSEYPQILEFIYHTVLILSSLFITYPIWPSTFKNEKFISITWNLGVFYILVFVGGLLTLLSNFGQFQLMIFLLNIVVISILMRWQIALFLIFIGVSSSILFFKWYLGVENFSVNIVSLQFKIMYILLLVSSVLIAFLKPKQEQHELTEEKNEHLNERITEREKLLEKALALKNQFIRNVNHEFHAPMTGIITMAQVLVDKYDKLTDQQRLTAAKTILKSSANLDRFEANLLSLSKLARNVDDLNKAYVNLSELLYNQIDICRKLYTNGKNNQEFIIKIEESIIAYCDENYIRQTFDNLIINAITYSKEGKITIELKKVEGEIKFSISDEGIGIPENELDYIFGEFIVSSRTSSPAGGRGIGLALCKKVIDLHKGKIWAENNTTKGVTFNFILYQT